MPDPRPYKTTLDYWPTDVVPEPPKPVAPPSAPVPAPAPVAPKPIAPKVPAVAPAPAPMATPVTQDLRLWDAQFEQEGDPAPVALPDPSDVENRQYGTVEWPSAWGGPDQSNASGFAEQVTAPFRVGLGVASGALATVQGHTRHQDAYAQAYQDAWGTAIEVMPDGAIKAGSFKQAAIEHYIRNVAGTAGANSLDAEMMQALTPAAVAYAEREFASAMNRGALFVIATPDEMDTFQKASESLPEWARTALNESVGFAYNQMVSPSVEWGVTKEIAEFVGFDTSRFPDPYKSLQAQIDTRVMPPGYRDDPVGYGALMADTAMSAFLPYGKAVYDPTEGLRAVRPDLNTGEMVFRMLGTMPTTIASSMAWERTGVDPRVWATEDRLIAQEAYNSARTEAVDTFGEDSWMVPIVAYTAGAAGFGADLLIPGGPEFVPSTYGRLARAAKEAGWSPSYMAMTRTADALEAAAGTDEVLDVARKAARTVGVQPELELRALMAEAALGRGPATAIESIVAKRSDSVNLLSEGLATAKAAGTATAQIEADLALAQKSLGEARRVQQAVLAAGIRPDTVGSPSTATSIMRSMRRAAAELTTMSPERLLARVKKKNPDDPMLKELVNAQTAAEQERKSAQQALRDLQKLRDRDLREAEKVLDAAKAEKASLDAKRSSKATLSKAAADEQAAARLQQIALEEALAGRPVPKVARGAVEDVELVRKARLAEAAQDAMATFAQDRAVVTSARSTLGPNLIRRLQMARDLRARAMSGRTQRAKALDGEMNALATELARLGRRRLKVQERYAQTVGKDQARLTTLAEQIVARGQQLLDMQAKAAPTIAELEQRAVQLAKALDDLKATTSERAQRVAARTALRVARKKQRRYATRTVKQGRTALTNLRTEMRRLVQVQLRIDRNTKRFDRVAGSIDKRAAAGQEMAAKVQARLAEAQKQLADADVLTSRAVSEAATDLELLKEIAAGRAATIANASPALQGVLDGLSQSMQRVRQLADVLGQPLGDMLAIGPDILRTMARGADPVALGAARHQLVKASDMADAQLNDVALVLEQRFQQASAELGAAIGMGQVVGASSLANDAARAYKMAEAALESASQIQLVLRDVKQLANVAVVDPDVLAQAKRIIAANASEDGVKQMVNMTLANETALAVLEIENRIEAVADVTRGYANKLRQMAEAYRLKGGRLRAPPELLRDIKKATGVKTDDEATALLESVDHLWRVATDWQTSKLGLKGLRGVWARTGARLLNTFSAPVERYGNVDEEVQRIGGMVENSFRTSQADLAHIVSDAARDATGKINAINAWMSSTTPVEYGGRLIKRMNGFTLSNQYIEGKGANAVKMSLWDALRMRVANVQKFDINMGDIAKQNRDIDGLAKAWLPSENVTEQQAAMLVGKTLQLLKKPDITPVEFMRDLQQFMLRTPALSGLVPDQNPLMAWYRAGLALGYSTSVQRGLAYMQDFLGKSDWSQTAEDMLHIAAGNYGKVRSVAAAMKQSERMGLPLLKSGVFIENTMQGPDFLVPIAGMSKDQPFWVQKAMVDRWASLADEFVKSTDRYSQWSMVSNALGSMYSMWKRSVVGGAMLLDAGYLFQNLQADNIQGSIRTGLWRTFKRHLSTAPANVPGGSKVQQAMVDAAASQGHVTGRLNWFFSSRRQAQAGAAAGRPVLPGIAEVFLNPPLNNVLNGRPGSMMAGGVQLDYDEVRRLAAEEGVFQTYPQSELLAEISRGVAPTWRNLPGRWAETIGDHCDVVAKRQRMALFLEEMALHGDARLAGRAVNEAFYDYANFVTTWEKRYISSMAPFYSFWKNDIAAKLRAMKELVETPTLRTLMWDGQISRMRRLAAIRQLLTQNTSGRQRDGDDGISLDFRHAFMQDWMKTRTSLGLRKLTDQEVQWFLVNQQREVDSAVTVLAPDGLMDSWEIILAGPVLIGGLLYEADKAWLGGGHMPYELADGWESHFFTPVSKVLGPIAGPTFITMAETAGFETGAFGATEYTKMRPSMVAVENALGESIFSEMDADDGTVKMKWWAAMIYNNVPVANEAMLLADSAWFNNVGRASPDTGMYHYLKVLRGAAAGALRVQERPYSANANYERGVKDLERTLQEQILRYQRGERWHERPDL